MQERVRIRRLTSTVINHCIRIAVPLPIVYIISKRGVKPLLLLLLRRRPPPSTIGARRQRFLIGVLRLPCQQQ